MNGICKNPDNKMSSSETVGVFMGKYCKNTKWQSIPEGEINQYKCG